MQTRQKILIVNLAGMGDVILASPAVKNLKKSFPDGEIYFLTFRNNFACVEHCPYLSGIFTFVKNDHLGNIRTLFSLRGCCFDKIINLYNIHTWMGALKMWLVFSLINAKETFGRNTAGRGFFYHHQQNESGNFEKPESLAMSETAALAGATNEPYPMELWVRGGRESIDAFFSGYNILPQDNLICLHPGATHLSRRWPLERFALVADYLAEKYKARIIVTGTEDDIGLAGRLQNLAKTPLINACGRLSFNELAACLERCRLLITNETGPMHVAAVLKTPTVIISGNTFKAFLPPQEEHIVILRKESRQNPGPAPALYRISCLEVFEAADRLLRRNNIFACLPSQKNSGPVKVLHLHTRAIIGGSSANVLLSIEGLPNGKCTGHLACGKKGCQEVFLKQVRDKNIPLHLIPHLQNDIHVINDALALMEIILLIKQERYHIVHTHNSKAGVLGRIAAKLCRTELIVHTIHSCEFNYAGTGFVQRNLFLAIEKVAAFCTDCFIAISEHIKSEFIKYRIAPENKITVIYSGIELERFRREFQRDAKRRELGFNERDVVVGIVSRLEEGKGHRALLRAMPQVLNQHDNARFLIVGDGPLRYELEKFLKNANINGRVVLTGLRTDIAEILKSIDIFCSASPYEGMGRAVLEAQASGIPVVANRSGGIPDIVMDRKTAILTEAGNNQSLSDALITLMGDERLRKDMGQEAAKFVDERFSAKKMSEDINRLYEAYLNQS